MIDLPSRVYTHLVVHPLNEDGSHEVWGSYTSHHTVIGEFETDALIGWLYPLANGWVWLNEAGHPTQIFLERGDVIAWLQGRAPSMEWLPNQ